MRRRLAPLVAVAVAVALAPAPARAFWLLNFQTAPPLDPGAVAFIGGTGGQVTLVGDPLQPSYTPFLAHAGIRVGIASWLDAGYRLTTVPLPYANAGGPSLGAQLDVKLRLTPAAWSWQAGLIVDGAYAVLVNTGRTLEAWSPGADLVVSRALGERYVLAFNARYSFTAIPSAKGGGDDNLLHAFGGSVGLRVGLGGPFSVMPEVGVFRFVGRIAGATNDGWGFQYGVVLGARIR